MMFLPGPITFVNAQVVGDAGVIASSLRVARSLVVDLDNRPAPGDQVIDTGGDIVFPGLINAHDHLAHNLFPPLKWRSSHRNVREWIEDFQPRFASDEAIRAVLARPLQARMLHGLIKNLLSGVVTACHHDPKAGMPRVLLPCAVVRDFGWSHSLGVDGEEKVEASYRATPPYQPWVIHAAEGIDDEAAGEFDRLEAIGCVAENTVLVHGLGLTPEARRRLVERGGSLVWCPSSNRFLFGAVANVQEFIAAGRLALGTDSRLSGARDLLEELKCARATGLADDRTLCRLVTSAAARILGLKRRAVLSPGEPADLIVAPRGRGDCFAALVESERCSLRLVMRKGQVHLADPEFALLFESSRLAPHRVRVDGKPKLLNARLVRQLRRLAIEEPGLDLQA